MDGVRTRGSSLRHGDVVATVLPSGPSEPAVVRHGFVASAAAVVIGTLSDLAPYIPFLALTWAFYGWGRLRNSRTGRATLLANQAAGLTEPVSLHPLIDSSRCLGSGACVLACPEENTLGVIGGKAQLIAPADCIGHGAQLICPILKTNLTARLDASRTDRSARIQHATQAVSPGGACAALRPPGASDINAPRHPAPSRSRRAGRTGEVCVVKNPISIEMAGYRNT